MAISPHHTMNDDFMKALGIDQKNVGSIRIDLQPDSLPQVTIVKYLFGEDLEHVRRLVEKYNLVPKEDA